VTALGMVLSSMERGFFFSSIKDILVVFVVSFVAFNLQHLQPLESFLEVVEVLAHIRRRSAVSRTIASTFLNAFC
jgi:hypothetical protein